jgi:LemA family protein
VVEHRHRLRRRHDLIPNLLETVARYAVHERQVLAEVTEARAVALGTMGNADPSGTQAGAENALVGSLRHLLAVAEAYPDLEADGSFRALQDELTNTEDRIGGPALLQRQRAGLQPAGRVGAVQRHRVGVRVPHGGVLRGGAGRAPAPAHHRGLTAVSL